MKKLKIILMLIVGGCLCWVTNGLQAQTGDELLNISNLSQNEMTREEINQMNHDLLYQNNGQPLALNLNVPNSDQIEQQKIRDNMDNYMAEHGWLNIPGFTPTGNPEFDMQAYGLAITALTATDPDAFIMLVKINELQQLIKDAVALGDKAKVLEYQAALINLGPIYLPVPGFTPTGNPVTDKAAYLDALMYLKLNNPAAYAELISQN